MKYEDKKIRELIADYFTKEWGGDIENKEHAKTCFYSIIEGYISDCPGDTGDILTVVFGTSDCAFLFFIKENGLERIEINV